MDRINPSKGLDIGSIPIAGAKKESEKPSFHKVFRLFFIDIKVCKVLEYTIPYV